MACPTEEEKPSKFQIKILEKIVDNEIGTINYRKPQKQLGSIGETQDISNVLRNLEDERVLELIPKKRFKFFDASVYQINKKKAVEVYDSYLNEE